LQPQSIDNRPGSSGSDWLKSYYFLRFAVSAVWVVLAFTIAKDAPAIAAIMLVAYPAWDALANFIDANRSGGLGNNKTQLLNFIVSVVVAAAIAIALSKSMGAVLTVYGAWATLSGLFQLLTAVRRRKLGGQWPMILSGAQSVIAGIFFVKMAGATQPVGIVTVAPYAAFGAFYFLVSAIWLTVSDARHTSKRAAV
jgi:hypothetical protein